MDKKPMTNPIERVAAIIWRASEPLLEVDWTDLKPEYQQEFVEQAQVAINECLKWLVEEADWEEAWAKAQPEVCEIDPIQRQDIFEILVAKAMLKTFKADPHLLEGGLV